MSQSPNESSVLLEENKRLSESCLWRLQREYFDNQGINAWVNQVPFYITTNPFIAHSYAQVIFNFIRDWITQHPEAKAHPFYILEMGTGSGRFSFYFIKALLDLLDTFKLTDIQFKYIMTDITRNNIKYYENHHALKPYIERGLIDFAIYNMESEKPIILLRENAHLDQKILQNPLSVLGNYIFDTVSHDAFAVHNEKIYELLYSIKTESSNLQNNRPVSLEKLETEYRLREITTDYYPDPALNKVLETYKKEIKQSAFPIPIGSIRALKYLSKLANNKLFMITSDKGYTTIKSLDNRGDPSLSFHSCFSLMVNFHAVAEFLKNSGDDYFLQTPRKGLKTAVFCKGLQLNQLPQTSWAIKEYIEGFSTADYFTIHRRVSDSFQECNLDMLASHMNLTRWDPHMYLKIKSRVISVVNETEPDVITFLSKHMHTLASNFYEMPQVECVLFEIAVFFHAIKNYAEALYYYEQSQPYVGEQFSLRYNIALCQHYLGQKQEALINFKRALELNKDSKETEEWINYIEKE